jgi:hypothetical protein
MNNWRWDAEPGLVREYTRGYLQALGCVLRRDRERDGFSVAVTARAPLSSGSLALFLAAARDLYAHMVRVTPHLQSLAEQAGFSEVRNGEAPPWLQFVRAVKTQT